MVHSDEYVRTRSPYYRDDESLRYKVGAVEKSEAGKLFKVDIPDELGVLDFSS